MKNIYLFELSDVFDDQVYLPYSSGVVWSYAKNIPEIKKNYILKDWFFYRDDEKNIINKIQEPQILLFSCFMWNWTLNCEIAKKIKNKFPKCLVIFGGQHQPLADRNEGFFTQHPYVDILIHGEGEETVKEILLKFLNSKHSFKDITGITLNIKNQEYRTLPRKRLSDIHINPSPFLDGSYDFLIKKNNNEKKFKFHATVESARGCPFSCSFCEIGERYYNKIKTSYDKTKKEIDWIAQNKIEYVTDANSNFGILFEQDYDLAKYVVKVKKKTAYPKAYRVTWAKDKGDKVLQIAKILEEADAQKAVTIALQSMSPKVLKAIKRKNIDGGKLVEFIELYKKNDIASYIELIWGLPEETLESFIDGICSIMEYDFHNYLDIHLMMVLPNAPISSQDYRKKYGTKLNETQPRFSHRSNPKKLVSDTISIITQTNSFTKEEWVEAHQFRWLAIFGHFLGPLQFISRALRKLYNISYKDFYTNLLTFAEVQPDTFIGNEYWNIKNNLEKILNNKRHWGDIIHEAGNINWEVDEATCIRLTKNKGVFYSEIKKFILEKYNTKINQAVLEEIFNYQILRLHDPYKIYPTNKKFHFNIHDILEDNAKLKKEDQNLSFDGKNFDSNIYDWAREILWFGRRIGKYKNTVIKNAVNY